LQRSIISIEDFRSNVMRATNNPKSIPAMHRIAIAASLLALPLALSACGTKDKDKDAIAQLDEKLTGQGSDPAMNTALDDRILVDPALTDSANVTAVREASQPLNGALPADNGYEGSTPSKADLQDTKMMHAPAPTIVEAGDCKDCGEKRAVTLGGMANDQGVRRGGRGTCDAKLQYGANWATRMPAEFPVYPKGRVKEAGGVDGGICNIRVVSFTTSATRQDVVDYYYSRAKHSGFSADYEIRAGEHTLGGVRDQDGGAFVVTFDAAPGGTTAVNIVANNGR
jgi:hypothetical protein